MSPAPLPLGPRGGRARRRYVEALKRRLDGGAYAVDPAEVADALLAAWREIALHRPQAPNR